MTLVPTTPDAPITSKTIEQVLLNGDLSSLNAEQRLAYYKTVCTNLGLDPLTRPFQYIVLNRKLTLYASKACTDQLRSLRGVSIDDVSASEVGGCYVVTAKARDADGRTDTDLGSVPIKNLSGDALCNAMKKAVTQAKRRVTLSLCGLGMLDETEVTQIPEAVVVSHEEVEQDDPNRNVVTHSEPVVDQSLTQEDANRDHRYVSSVEAKQSQKGQEFWVVEITYYGRNEDGELVEQKKKGTTFNSSLADVANSAMRSKTPVVGRFRKSGEHINLVELEVVLD